MFNEVKALESLREFARLGGRGSAEELETYAFRRGAARAITHVGGSFAKLMKACQWLLSACRLFLYRGQEKARAGASIPLRSPEDEVPGANLSRDAEPDAPVSISRKIPTALSRRVWKVSQIEGRPCRMRDRALFALFLLPIHFSKG